MWNANIFLPFTILFPLINVRKLIWLLSQYRKQPQNMVTNDMVVSRCSHHHTHMKWLRNGFIGSKSYCHLMNLLHGQND